MPDLIYEWLHGAKLILGLVTAGAAVSLGWHATKVGVLTAVDHINARRMRKLYADAAVRITERDDEAGSVTMSSDPGVPGQYA